MYAGLFSRLGRSATSCAFGTWLCVSFAAQSQLRTPQPLDDRAFWDLIVSLSEPDGFYSDENYVSNELDLERVLPDLERTFEPGGVYLGVGPEQNFSYVAALRPRIAFIVDIRRQNAMELLLYKALFELADDRADFLSLLFSRPKVSEAHSAHSIAAYSDVAVDPALFDNTLGSI